MSSFGVDRIGIAMLDWLMRIGLGRAVLAITAFSIAMSLAISGISVALFMPYLSFAQWGYVAIAAPAVIAPIVSFSIMSLAYRLAEAQTALAQAAATDALTGIGNRRRFFDIAVRELACAKRDKTPLSILMLDLDHFKTLNDRFGHAAGDEALIQVARRCTERLRATDVICRWGGEEFIILLQKTSLDAACGVAEDLRRGIAALKLERSTAKTTASIGVTQVEATAVDLDAIIAAADRQLYRAKSAGRNQVMPQPRLLN